MTARFIVIAAQAEAASQVSDDFAKLVPSSTLARVSAGGTSTIEAITSNPEQALPRVVEDIRSQKTPSSLTHSPKAPCQLSTPWAGTSTSLLQRMRA